MVREIKVNGKGEVRLTWPQLVWAVATLATLLGAWFDLRAQVSIVRVEMDQRFDRAMDERKELKERVFRLERAVKEEK